MSCFSCEHFNENTERCLKLNKILYKYQGDVKLYVCPVSCEHFIDISDDYYGD